MQLAKLNAKEKAVERKTGTVPAFLRTHPLTEDRVDMVQQELPQVGGEGVLHACMHVTLGVWHFIHVMRHSLASVRCLCEVFCRMQANCCLYPLT